ncbi:transposase [Phenylobacterium hankyongense]|uniref:Flagellar hook protein FlgE n=1 Tax=Phenylobacterium hankyongense TaxID=1813876 RepID=A0A328AZC8_9CAUL|nr:flagellar hook protein FlgE [Phenylobacterium hankyongense]RAK60470.1 transposase [Phenylobacterium hankyongense]
MSINSAMLAGVSGLIANSASLAAISDNIANVNTTAYKRNQVNFASVVTAQGVAGRYSAGGVSGVTHQFVAQQGQVQSAAQPTDLAISGDGFFIATQKATGLTNADARLFTRAGAFGVDANGYLVNDAKLYLQGWPVQPNGTFNTNPSDMSLLAPINVKGLGTAVSATTGVDISANLDSSGAISAGEGAYSAAAGTSMADYAKDPTTGTKPDFSMDMNVIDSQGATHKFTVGFLKSSAAPNTWHAEVYAVPDTDVAVAGAPGQLTSGLVKFNQDGTVDLANSTLFGAAGAPAKITLAASGTVAAAPAPPKWDDALGVQGQSVTLDLSKFTQYSQASTVNSINSDGAGVGNVVGVQVSDTGIVSAIFDNSQVRQIAKIALATFPNADGLQSVSGNAYRATLAAGQLVIKQPGLGAGAISPSSLEASTVDLSSEFTGLISTQKAYSASSKIITTADQMLQELISIIR